MNKIKPQARPAALFNILQLNLTHFISRAITETDLIFYTLFNIINFIGMTLSAVQL